MRYLITGGAGFIGSHLVELLNARGDTAIVLDDLSTGKSSNIPAETKLIKGDITDPGILENALKQVDGCFHLAAVASVQQYTKNWVEASRTNLLGSVMVLETAAKCDIPVVYASSAAVYGDNPDTPLIENTRVNPISGYGADKLALELHASSMCSTLGLRSVGLRFFNVFGPRQNPGSAYSGVISIFLQHLIAGKTLSIFGDGHQCRDFIYVGDIAESLFSAMTYASRGNSGVYNICSGTPTTIIDLATAIGKILDVPVEKKFMPHRVGDIRVSLGDPALARQTLGVQTEIELEEGLRRTANWFLDNLPIG